MELIDKEILVRVKKSIYEFADIIKEDDNDSYNKLIRNWNIIEMLFSDFDQKYNWPMLKDDFKGKFDLNIRSLNGTMWRLQGERFLKKEIDYFINGKVGRGTTTHINKSGAKKILERMKSIEGAKFLYKEYGIVKRIPLCLACNNIIKYALKNIEDIEKEYSTIHNYRIDLYLKTSKLAIECDEHDHDHETLNTRIDRQQAIEKYLGCRFLRFNPHPQRMDFNMGLVIKVVLHVSYNKSIDGKDPIDYYNEKRPKSNRERDIVIVDL